MKKRKKIRVMSDKEFGRLILDFTSPYAPQKGYFLLANPFMRDINFARTVVLLIEHETEGSLGYVLNRPVNIPAHSKLWKEMFLEGAFIGYGGPVHPHTLHVIHRRPDVLGGKRILPGVYWQGNIEYIPEALEKKEIEPSDFKTFLGYAGWGYQQLEAEMQEKAWIAAPATEKAIFEIPPKRLWQDVLSSLGLRYKIMSNFPQNPFWN